MIDKIPHIPGATPIDDISGLKIRSINTLGQLYEAEFENTAKAVSKYLVSKPTNRMAPFNLNWIKKLHREMFGDVWTWAGKIRQTEKNIGIKPFQIETSLQDLLDDLFVWQNRDMDLIEQAATLHYKAVFIHPFDNGNGRWARLLANIWLKKNSGIVTVWPENDMTKGTSKIRDEYLQALKAADNGSYDKLIDIHRRYTETKE